MLFTHLPVTKTISFNASQVYVVWKIDAETNSLKVASKGWVPGLQVTITRRGVLNSIPAWIRVSSAFGGSAVRSRTQPPGPEPEPQQCGVIFGNNAAYVEIVQWMGSVGGKWIEWEINFLDGGGMADFGRCAYAWL